MKSMTGYARRVYTAPEGRYVVEIQSVNRKHLEIHTHLPTELSPFDIEVRKWVSERIQRGSVVVRISAFFDGGVAPVRLSPNIPHLKQLMNVFDELAKECGAESKKFPLEAYLSDPALIVKERVDEADSRVRESLQHAVTACLKDLDVMRLCEGEALMRDFQERVDKVLPIVDLLAVRTEGATLRYRDQLIARLKELTDNAHLLEDERILREVALFAEKIDIAEEITRLNSHLKQFRDLVKSGQVAVGKTLDFLLQEMNREVNTIGSKTADTLPVISLKSEIERMREQIQNVE